MPAKLEWKQIAQEEFLQHIDYIADESPDAAQKLKDEVESKVNELPEHPKLYRPGRVPGTREMVVRANYIVVYEEDETMVTVLRVLHAAQLYPPQ
ncbi:type II toxin-antitoxin system RelE/ParE family toxin [Bordetella genomosp. 13]|uniref:Addiction module antitoxin n=1 Tax=Bordetella genomosp. 13 TaxID=463040 RepID=A0A1W6ZH54_9BORD|nr:type II toxin-antitoxin system RelE/ParE family toxin [Bordetella genomosp. 13]ARP96728.1 addiction module antitoxin [Bordetella genomosp. 13]